MMKIWNVIVDESGASLLKLRSFYAEEECDILRGWGLLQYKGEADEDVKGVCFRVCADFKAKKNISEDLTIRCVKDDVQKIELYI